MSREIKFRLWNNVESGGSRMFYDTEQVMECLKQQLLFENKEHKYHKLGYDHIGDGSVFMQYTGLKDEKGIEIYEGDIMQYGVMKKPVVFSCGSFGVVNQHPDGQSFGSYQIQNGIVIGNVHQNPELLTN